MGIFNEFAVCNSALKLEWGDLTKPRNFVADLSRTDTAIHVEYKSTLIPTYYVHTNANGNNCLSYIATNIICKPERNHDKNKQSF